MLDILIKDALIVDGSGKKGYKGAIGIKDNVIECIEERTGLLKGNIIIDAQGKVVCPGFIDVHSHGDLAILRDPLCKDKIQQGITTQVIGNCGQSVAPLKEGTVQSLRNYVTPVFGNIPGEWEWESFKEYLSLIQKQGVATNIVPLVGHLTIRVAAMGFDSRNLTPEELEKMKLLVTEALEAGTFGLSTGLTYPPSCYATTDELVKLCKIVARSKGIYVSHTRVIDSVKKAVKEAIYIGENTNIPVEISHLQISGKIQGESIQDTFRLVEEARERGIDITYDQYPYKAGSGLMAAILPPTLVYKGNIDETVNYLSNKTVREKISKELEDTKTDWENVIITSSLSDNNKHLEGKSIKTIALLKNKSPLDLLIDLLVKEKISTVGIFFGKNEEDLCEIVKHPCAMVGTDGLYNSGKLHPRSWGTFPKMLRKYVREDKTLTIEDAIKKMTYLPAKKLELRDRGRIDKGMMADVVVFDLAKIEDAASYECPVNPPKGIEYVIINGQIVLNKGRHEKILQGKVLKRE